MRWLRCEVVKKRGSHVIKKYYNSIWGGNEGQSKHKVDSEIHVPGQLIIGTPWTRRMHDELQDNRIT